MRPGIQHLAARRAISLPFSPSVSLVTGCCGCRSLPVPWLHFHLGAILPTPAKAPSNDVAGGPAFVKRVEDVEVAATKILYVVSRVTNRHLGLLEPLSSASTALGYSSAPTFPSDSVVLTPKNPSRSLPLSFSSSPSPRHPVRLLDTLAIRASNPHRVGDVAAPTPAQSGPRSRRGAKKNKDDARGG